MNDTLFDLTAYETPVIKRPIIDLEYEDFATEEWQPLNDPELEKWAFLYTATQAGDHSGVRFILSVEDAKKWCSLKVSSGVISGGRWAYFWTSIANYFNGFMKGEEPKLDLSREVDNGTWDERIAKAGCKKIGLDKFAEFLTPFGIKVVGTPTVMTVKEDK